MFDFKNLFFTLLFLTFFIGFVAAQPPASVSSNRSNSQKITQNKQNFVSLDGGFTIALPQQIDGLTGVKPIAGMNKGGSQLVWRTQQGLFFIAYTDRIFSPENYKQVLEDSANGLITDVTNNNGKLISKNEISFDGNSGIEVRMQINEAAVGLARYILVKERMYILSTGWKNGDDGKEQLKILDTFKLVDRKTAIAQKIAEATPDSLPQSPAAKKLKSDAEDDGLKGKVKLVTETEEDLAGTWSVSGIMMSYEDFYDEKGNRTKHIYYDYRGNPSDITIYGFIDGLKVAKSGSVRYEYNPPLAMPPPPPPLPAVTSSPNAEKPKPADTRYSTKYDYKYDDKGRLQETIRYRNNGDMTGRTVYLYDGSKMEESSFDKDGKLISKTIDIFDDKLNLIERTYVRQNSKLPDSKYTYTYELFDSKGNWTKRVVKGKEGVMGGGFKDQHYVEYRAITYYQ